MGEKENKNKVITTMVIRPLDDRIYCVWSVFTHLWLWQNPYDCSLHHFTTNQWILKYASLTFSSTSNRLAEIWKGDFSASLEGDANLPTSTRRPTNWWSSAERDVTHPTATVVCNTCHHLFRKRSCITMHRLAWGNWPRQQYDTSHLYNA